MKSRFAVSVLSWLARMPAPVADATGRLIGRFVHRKGSRNQRRTQINLALAYPDMPLKDRLELERQSLKDLGEKAARLARVWVLGSENPDQLRDPEDLDDWNQAIKAGEGMLLLVPHLGNWELLGGWVAEHGVLNAMYRPARLQGVDELILNGRVAQGYQMHPTNVKGVAGLLKSLKKGEIVAVLPDQEPDLDGGEFAPFFGVPALTMTLAHKLAQKQPSAAVFIAAAVRLDARHYQVVLQRLPGFGAQPTQAGLTQMNLAIESLVRRYPEQYQWEYKRFQTRPDGEPSPY